MSKFWAVIPAGGQGLRFGSQVPKQYITVAGMAVLDHVLHAFLKFDAFETIVVPIPSEDSRFHYLTASTDDRIVAIVGGQERADSVFAGLEWIVEQGADQYDWVFVHDAARPLITQNELHALRDVIDVPACPGAVLGVPAADSLKRVDQIGRCPAGSDSCIAKTLDRTGLWHAMTPQVFRLGGLMDALVGARASGFVVTDEAQAMEAEGSLPWLIHGRRSNIKLTHPEDLELIEALLTAREERSA